MKKMEAAIEQHVLYQILNAPLRFYPFPHVYVEDVFPYEYYAKLRQHRPKRDEYRSLQDLNRISKTKYTQRTLFPLEKERIHHLPEPKKTFWEHFAQRFGSEEFMMGVMHYFAEEIEEQHGQHSHVLQPCIDLVYDEAHYSIGPHTDHPHKLLTLLFYLPSDAEHSSWGTSLFLPKDPAMRCLSGEHYDFADFTLVHTLPFLPNSVVGFVRTDRSFHGVCPLTEEERERDTIAYTIKIHQGE